jgi:long-chain acyl-CoA synthetase
MAPSSEVRRARTLLEVYRLASEIHRDKPAFFSRRPAGDYTPMSFRELYESGLALATGLIDLGLGPREHVGLLSDNRVEWIMADYGVLLAGAADVPRGSDVTVQEVGYILAHADCRFAFVEDEKSMRKVDACRGQLPALEHVIFLSADAPARDGVPRLADLVARGRALRESGDRRVEERIEHVQSADLFTLIYTSGTTGRPKGVRLTHANMMSQIRNLCIELHDDDRFLSLLPVWHIYERVAMMIAIANGSSTWYTSVRTVADDLKTVRPTIMASAPRVWESLYLKIVHSVNQSGPLKRFMFRLAYFFSRRLRHSAYFIEGRRLDLTGRRWWNSLLLGFGEGLLYLALLVPYLVMDGLVTRKLRGILGGRFRGTISGGGALQTHVDEFFNYIGIPVLEGYGLTETCPVLAVRTFKKRVIGTVGPIWPETELRIVDLNNGAVLYPDHARPDGGRGLRGEIHARGPQVTEGYHKNPDLTAKVLRDGWFATGDIGMVTFNDCLKILGRCKETIVLLSGENVEPTPIEGRLCESHFIDQCMVVGQDQKHLAVLVVTKPAYFAGHGVTTESAAEVASHPVVDRIIGREIRSLINAAAGFRHFESIHAWRILPKAFEVGDELTATYKLKRHVVTDRYDELIRGIYHAPGRGLESARR